MKELEPLLRGDASDFERQLLNAARRERPSPQLQARMRGTLGLTGPVAWLGAARAALSTVAGKAGLGLAVAGLVAGGVVATGALERSAVEPASTAVAVPSAAAPAEPAPLEAAPPEVAPEASPEPVAAAEAEAEDANARQLREEIELLDRVRSALQRGARATALRELARYRERFPEGILSREATQLRQQVRAKVPAGKAR